MIAALFLTLAASQGAVATADRPLWTAQLASPPLPSEPPAPLTPPPPPPAGTMYRAPEATIVEAPPGPSLERRLVAEGLGGLAGILVGSLVPALLTVGCTAPSCFPTEVAASPGAFLMPLGMWIAGRMIDNPGGYWWAMLGSLPGWALTIVTYGLVKAAGNGRFNPVSFATLLLPIVPALALFEWSAARERRSRAASRVSVLVAPTVGGDGQGGLVAMGQF